jgi:methionine synthase II (cobalamin-independent)
MSSFTPNCLPLLIGSLPLDSHQEATDLIFQYTPDIPLWPQLPIYKREGMMQQFLPGLPGVTERDGKTFIDASSAACEGEMLAFYEEYLSITEGATPLDASRFQLAREAAPGFYTFLEQARAKKATLTALKGQTTGPVTFCIGLVDQDGRAIFYNDQLRDAAIKHLAMKARWQVRTMAEICNRTIMFFDEPGLAGLGSSAFITITREDIVACLSEVFDGVRAENGLTGVHVCANTEWSVVFESGVDIVSYDAYSFFDKLILYPEHLLKFFAGGGILASGIIPTTPEFIDAETTDSLVGKWFRQTEQLQAIGIEKEKIYGQTLITPSCGTGTVSREQAVKVLHLTKSVAEKIRASFL